MPSLISQRLAGNTFTIGKDRLIQWRIQFNGGEKVGRFIQKVKRAPRNLRALKCRWRSGENHFLSLFFPPLFRRDGDDSNRRKWKRFSGGGERACTSKTPSGACPHLSPSHSRRHALLSARQTAVFNLCDNTCGWPLICKGEPGAAPIWISTYGLSGIRRLCTQTSRAWRV